MQKKELIRLDEIFKIYDMGKTKVSALAGLSLKIHAGDFVAIMGPSGSGKSTAMNLVGSLDIPTKGKIFLDGTDIASLHESDLARIRGKKIGFIFQNFNLIQNLTTKENISLPMVFQGATAEEREKKADELLKLVELEDRGGHYPNQLSGGQQQRVAIARSLANDPEIILADEPTGNLDSKTGEKVMAFLNNLHKKGKTIIMVTHSGELAKKYAQIIYWIKDGKLEKITRKNK